MKLSYYEVFHNKFVGDRNEKNSNKNCNVWILFLLCKTKTWWKSKSWYGSDSSEDKKQNIQKICIIKSWGNSTWK